MRPTSIFPPITKIHLHWARQWQAFESTSCFARLSCSAPPTINDIIVANENSTRPSLSLCCCFRNPEHFKSFRKDLLTIQCDGSLMIEEDSACLLILWQ